MTNTGCLNLRGKDGSQSSITCEKADCQPAHKFISRSNFHFFLRVLGLDFCLTAQILPSTPETSFVRMR